MYGEYIKMDEVTSTELPLMFYRHVADPILKWGFFIIISALRKLQ